MSEHSKIEWTDASWNPIVAVNKATGGRGHFCVHVSPGCVKCYAERMQPRFGNPIRFAAQDRARVDIHLDEKVLAQPLAWRKPRMIFVCSMTDLFAEWVPDEWIDKVFAVMARCPQHTFQVLTKRASRMREYFTGAENGAKRELAVFATAYEMTRGSDRPESSLRWPGWPLPNVWVGTSVEDQPRADERLWHLRKTPAAVRWVSAEPLLAGIDLERVDVTAHVASTASLNALTGEVRIAGHAGESSKGFHGAKIDWVVVGGESGPGARPMHPDWARSVRDQCAAAGVPFFFKQWGEWAPIEPGEWTGPPDEVGSSFHSNVRPGDIWMRRDGQIGDGKGERSSPPRMWAPAEMAIMRRLGKKAAGRLLDGRLHDAMPAPPTVPSPRPPPAAPSPRRTPGSIPPASHP